MQYLPVKTFNKKSSIVKAPRWRTDTEKGWRHSCRPPHRCSARSRIDPPPPWQTEMKCVRIIVIGNRRCSNTIMYSSSLLCRQFPAPCPHGSDSPWHRFGIQLSTNSGIACNTTIQRGGKMGIDIITIIIITIFLTTYFFKVANPPTDARKEAAGSVRVQLGL